MLGGDPSGSSVGAAENYRTGHIAARHVISLASRIDNLINRLHGEIESHELAASVDMNLQGIHQSSVNIHRTKSLKSSTDSKASEAHFSDGGIDNTLLAKLIQKAPGNLSSGKN